MVINTNSSSSTVATGSGPGRPWKSGGKALAALTLAVVTAAAGVTLSAGAGPAGAATKPNWIMTAGNIQRMNSQDPATTAHFFNTAASYGPGASLVQTPVQHGYATTPVLSYTSYAQFRSDAQNGRITYPYRWVMYDPEKWAGTPVGEQQHPVKYLRLFGQLAHAEGMKAVEAPSLDLGAVTGSALPRLQGETLAKWYTRVNIAGAAAATSDIYILQDESNTASLSQYASLYNTSSAQARAANPGIAAYSEVSTVNGTPDEMTAAAKSIHPDGFYVAAPGSISQAAAFFQNMKAAGY